MARVTPEQAAQKLIRRGSAAVEDLRDGVNRVTDAPGRAAAAAQDKMLAGVQAAVTSGKWARRVSAVSLEDWKAATAGKGADRYPAGLAAAEGKLTEFYGKLLPYVDRVRGEVRRMPSGTLEQNIARATKFMRDMANFER